MVNLGNTNYWMPQFRMRVYKMLKKLLEIISVFAVIAFFSPAYGTETPQVTGMPMEADIQQLDKQNEVEAFLKKAEDYVKTKGKKEALAEFNKSDGQFTTDAYYIFVIDYKGNMLADGSAPNVVGQNVLILKNIDNKNVVQDMIEKAKAGGGWVEYRWTNPINNLIECKKSLVKPMDDYFIAVGYYYRPNADGECTK